MIALPVEVLAVALIFLVFFFWVIYHNLSQSRLRRRIKKGLEDEKSKKGGIPDDSFTFHDGDREVGEPDEVFDRRERSLEETEFDYPRPQLPKGGRELPLPVASSNEGSERESERPKRSRRRVLRIRRRRK